MKEFCCSIITILLLCNTMFVQAQKNAKPNIIVIFADDMGYGDLGSYGHPLIRTNNLDRMADEGIRLTSFYVAASSCTPSRAALLTGRYPLRSGLPHVILPDNPNGLHSTEITMARALKEQGYRTMCIGKWHLGQQKSEYSPLSHGFDHYFGLITSNDMMRPWVETDVPLTLRRDNSELNEFPVDQSTLTTRYTQEAIKFIRNSGKKPFFLYMPHSMSHVPLAVDRQDSGMSAAGFYGDVVESIDRSVGEILKTLKENKLDKNTIVVFTSDNGPWNNMPDRMYREDIVKPWDAGTAGLLRGGKGTSYEGGFRVPCIVRWPGRIPAGQVSSKVMTSLDLFPTLVDLAGGLVPSDRQMDGVNVMPLLAGDVTFERGQDFYYYQGVALQAIRSGPWKLRFARYTGEGTPENTALEPELYNLQLDPSEQFNRAWEFPEVVRELKEKMKAMKMEGSVVHF